MFGTLIQPSCSPHPHHQSHPFPHCCCLPNRSGNSIDAIQFITNKGHSSPKYGGGGGVQHTVRVSGGTLAYISGRSGNRIDALSIAFQLDPVNTLPFLHTISCSYNASHMMCMSNRKKIVMFTSHLRHLVVQVAVLLVIYLSYLINLYCFSYHYHPYATSMCTMLSNTLTYIVLIVDAGCFSSSTCSRSLW
jgi:hypothetical protein